MNKLSREEVIGVFRMAMKNGYTIDTRKHEGLVRFTYRNDEGNEKSLMMNDYSFLSLSAEALGSR